MVHAKGMGVAGARGASQLTPVAEATACRYRRPIPNAEAQRNLQRHRQRGQNAVDATTAPNRIAARRVRFVYIW